MRSIVELFELQVKKYPDRIGVKDHQNQFTYKELNIRANVIANKIINEYGQKTLTAQRVALLLEQGVDILPGILGVLKAGKTYVALDPDYPHARLGYMLQDSGCRVIVTNGNNLKPAEQLKYRAKNEIAIINIDFIGNDSSENSLESKNSPESENNPEMEIQPEQAAYVMYTSGSTGNPKGVVQSHRNVVHFISAFTDELDIDYSDRIALLTSYSHTVSVIDIFSALFNGAAVCIYNLKSEKNLVQLSKWLMDEKITIYHSVPSIYRYLMETLSENDEFNDLRLVILGGETVFKKDIELYKKHFSRDCILVNLFGSSEVLIATSYLVEKESKIKGETAPVGWPVRGVEICLFNEKDEEAAVYEIGEMVYRSEYLAEGYLNSKEKTEEVFVKDPVTGEGRVYRSGDLGRLLPDGCIEYLGRKDFQVKIRGNRVELNEVEAVLDGIEGLKKSVVNYYPKEDGEGCLAAYYETRSGPGPDAAEMRATLAARLPDYMIPIYYIPVAELPKTPNGKIDRAALPAPEENPGARVELAAPGTDLEELIADLWKTVLKRDQIGINDNFFDIGGNSLSMLRLHHQVNQRLRTELKEPLSVPTMFQYPTINSLARFLNRKLRMTPNQEPALKSGIAGAKTVLNREIAVIGFAGKFPGADNILKYWENLKNGVESITFFSDEELQQAGITTDLLKNPNYIKAKGIIADPEYFDASFFEYSPADAQIMDPQMRIFLEIVWEALENAGYNPYTYQGPIGLFAGASNNVYWEVATSFPILKKDAAGIFNAVQLNNKDFLTTQVSYKLDLKGPSMLIQTACSTSLVAVNEACRSLMTGGCDIALAGGVSMVLPLKNGYIHQEGMIMSSDGHCRAFDAKADGTVWGQGAGVVVLKRLEDARRDGDTIWAIIKGSEINNDGRNKVGFAAPGVEGQYLVIRKALSAAGIDPETIGYVETHGTGTALGDPIEIEALQKAFGVTKRNYCAIGSVKTNIGHLDAAAGVAGLIKTILALHYRQIPPSLHFQTLNPKIDMEQSPFFVNQALRDWESPGHPLRAGVSSFGIGGTNAHVVLEEAPKPETPGTDRPWHILTLSAKTASALERQVQNLAEYLIENPEINLADAAYTLQLGRAEFQYRRAVVCANTGEAAGQLRETRVPNLAESRNTIVFMFPGQGSQYLDMGKDLYRNEPEFREVMDHCFTIIKSLLPFDLKTALYPDEDRTGTLTGTDTAVSLPLMFIFEYALAQILMKWGIKPDAMIGHGIGEYVAACLAGVFTLEDAIAVVVLQGQLMREISAQTILDVPLSETELAPYLNGEVSLAAVNSTSLCAVSGDPAALQTLEQQLRKNGIAGITPQAPPAFHAGMKEPILAELVAKLRQLTLRKPQIPYLSNTTGKWIAVADAVSPEYWAGRPRATVRFADGLTEILKNDAAILIEIGPDRVLSDYVRRHRDFKPRQTVVNLVRHSSEEVPDLLFLYRQLGELWCAGLKVDWERFYQSEKRRRIPLPVYPFERQRFWIEDNPLAAIDDWLKQGNEVWHEGSPIYHLRPNIGVPYAAPEDEFEKWLAGIWQNELGIDRVGVNDNFFELGGSSVLGLRVVSHFNNQKHKLLIEDLFTYPTIRSLRDYFQTVNEPITDPEPQTIEPSLSIPRQVLVDRDKFAIKPLFDSGRSCFEDLLASVCGWLGRDFEMMFARAWSFSYQSAGPLGEKTFGSRIDCNMGDKFGDLLRYHGIQTSVHSGKTCAEILNIAVQELEAGRPVVMPCDTYWIPWDAGYQREGHDATHYFLIVGFDGVNQVVYCVDTIYSKYWEPLSLNHIVKGNLGECETYSLIDEIDTGMDWKGVIRNAVEHLQGVNGNENVFTAMRRLAADLAETFDIGEETKDQVNFLRAPIYESVRYIAKGRKQFGRLLEYLSQRFDIADMLPLAKRLDRAGGRWESMRALMLKMYKMFDQELYKNKVVEMIREAADDEESIAGELSRLCRQEAFTKTGARFPRAPGDTPVKGETVFVELSSHFNNCGCGGSIYESCRADLNGMKEFFLIESMPQEGVLAAGGMEFYFPKLADGKMDNLSCNGETLPAPPGRYSSIQLLGCGDEGHFSEDMMINYEDGTKETVDLEISCWWLPANYGETIVWSGKIISRADERIHQTPIQGRLYAQSYPLTHNGNVISVTLPDCPNIHLFAVSFTKKSVLEAV
jgi:amino acid adenylation domain-containing protein